MYKVTEKDLIGDIKDFPIEVVQKMVERQFEQYGICDVSAFQKYKKACSDGFHWNETAERFSFWDQVIGGKNFDLFFYRYPKQDFPLPRMVLVWNDHESKARERELLHVFPESLGLDFRYVVRSNFDRGRDVVSFKNMKELPAPKKMTKEEIEKELGYKIEIINNK